jgi:hypothetical protein
MTINQQLPQETLETISQLNLTIEVCGTWVWVSGDTKPHREALKKSGFRWASKKAQWYFRPEDSKARRHNGSWSMDKIRSKYGSDKVQRI